MVNFSDSNVKVLVTRPLASSSSMMALYWYVPVSRLSGSGCLMLIALSPFSMMSFRDVVLISVWVSLENRMSSVRMCAARFFL